VPTNHHGRRERPVELVTVSRTGFTAFKRVAETKPVVEKTHANATKPFIMWDGEAVQDGAGYCLFGCSEGYEICSPNLGTKECLDLILAVGKARPKSFHVAFAFDYDVNNILRELPWSRLIMLKERGRTTWEGYGIQHIPHKSFVVKKDKVRVKIDDVFSYFRCRYDRALHKYNIGTSAERDAITDGKILRPDFKFADILTKIRPYWKLELSLGVALMDKLRLDINRAGFFIGAWHGPGALASYCFNRNGVREHMAPIPDDISLAARTAYAGGWFERFKAGMYDGMVYTADINSAYVYALSRLPSLSTGTWVRHENNHGDALQLLSRTVRLGLFRIRFSHGFSAYMATSHGVPLPLFQRSSDGGISRPTVTDGWFWSYEARIVSRDPSAEFLEAWVYEDDGEYPFSWLEDMFLERLALQAENNPAEKALKWALASMYGITAQRAGWNRRYRSAPRWHQLEWAGAITSFCRSMIYAAASPVAIQNGLVSIDTDGIISTVPFENLPNGEGNQLGRWKVEQFSGLCYFQNGVYWLRDMQGDWLTPKIRGVPQDQIPTIDDAVGALRGDGKIRIARHNFIGYGTAIRGRRDAWRTWEDQEYSIDIQRAGSRQHLTKLCRACRQGSKWDEALHDLAMIMPNETESSPHKLPWLENDENSLQARLLQESIFGSEI
jgi:hypothetical protein